MISPVKAMLRLAVSGFIFSAILRTFSCVVFAWQTAEFSGMRVAIVQQIERPFPVGRGRFLNSVLSIIISS
jgi:hypothetical protein